MSDVKFDFVVGNPPYQGENHQQIYPAFFIEAKNVSSCVDMIFPAGWQDPKSANNLGKLNNKDTKEDKQIVLIDNRKNVFKGVPGADLCNIIIWKKGHDNGLNGYQQIFTDGENPQIKKLLYDKKDIEKPEEIVQLSHLVRNSSFGFEPLSSSTSVLKPYGLRTDVLEDPGKYGLGPIYKEKQQDNDLTVYCKGKQVRYVPNNYKLPKKSERINKYKVFIPYAWGNMSDSWLGGAYSDIIIAGPNDICTETYLESGSFEDFATAKKHAKYLMTRFARALLFLNKYSQHSTSAWNDVPTQSYEETWWNGSIDEIDANIMRKYDIPQNIQDFVFSHIQKKSEINIMNYNEDRRES